MPVPPAAARAVRSSSYTPMNSHWLVATLPSSFLVGNHLGRDGRGPALHAVAVQHVLHALVGGLVPPFALDHLLADRVGAGGHVRRRSVRVRPLTGAGHVVPSHVLLLQGAFDVLHSPFLSGIGRGSNR